MSDLFSLGQNLTTTENGAVSFSSSLDPLVDLFFKSGASRGVDLGDDFAKSYSAYPELTIRLGLWLRDIRSGAGEREQFKSFLRFIISNAGEDTVIRVMCMIPELGRWDDLETFWKTPYQTRAASFWLQAIEAGNGLAAKWAPRKDKKGAYPLRKAAGLTESNWRRYVVSRSSTVEQQMCSNKWTEINYSHVPSVASARYTQAFIRHDQDGYSKWKDQLVSGEAKINASAIFPHDVLMAAKSGDDIVATEQWKALPDFLEGSEERFLPIIDTSGSMKVQVSNSQTKVIDIACALGIYFAERNKSIFKDEFLAFSDVATPHKIKGETLLQKYGSIVQHQDWEMSTNLQAAIDWVLKTATHNNLSNDDLPTKLLIVSDMQFNECATQHSTNFEEIERKYKEAGYTMPGIIFWQVMSRPGSIPITIHNKNVAVVSGYSPSTIRDLMKGELDPVKSMLNVLNSPRYTY